MATRLCERRSKQEKTSPVPPFPILFQSLYIPRGSSFLIGTFSKSTIHSGDLERSRHSGDLERSIHSGDLERSIHSGDLERSIHSGDLERFGHSDPCMRSRYIKYY